MICPHCSGDLPKWRERSSGFCMHCRQEFALDPRTNRLRLHDLRLRKLAAVVSDPGGAMTPNDVVRLVGRRRAVVGGLAVLGLVAVLVTLGLSVDSGSSRAAGSCPAAVEPAVVPSWARAGFIDPEPRIPYVLGDRGEIVAILFGPLASPAAPGRSNKILWVVRDPGAGPLTIVATRDGGAPQVRQVSGGPGPSTIDLPEPGCWSMELRWSGHTDRLDLRYAAPTPG